MLKLRHLTIAACCVVMAACETDTGDDDGTLDAGFPTNTFDSGFSVPDSGYAFDGSLPSFDGSFPTFDSGLLGDGGFGLDGAIASDGGGLLDASLDGGTLDGATDAATPTDAGRDAATDATVPRDATVDATVPDGGNGACTTAEPHGCYTPKAGNPMGCPAKIHEQSASYPPFEEWEACSSPYYVPCVYIKPGGGEANCSCDLGLHWLCTY